MANSYLTGTLAIAALLAATTAARAQTGGVGIGTTTPNAAAVLDLSSTAKGLLLPRLSQSQRDAINPAASAAGLLVYNTDTRTLNAWDGSKWTEVLGSATGTTSTPPATTTFTYTAPGGPQTYIVPAGVTRITVTADGASGTTNAS